MLSNQLKRDWAEDIIVGVINLQTDDSTVHRGSERKEIREEN